MAQIMIDKGAPLTPALEKRRTYNISFVIALLGSIFYALLIFRSASISPSAFGNDIYDQLWLSIKDGRLDLPARVLRLEGHYLPDGTGFIYQGSAPLMTRILLDPVMTIGVRSLAPFSIWMWATSGTALWHASLLYTGTRSGGRTKLLVGLGVVLWLGGPGALLATNHAFFHEPISLAYAATGAFVLLCLHVMKANHISAFSLAALAILAALTVHARPNLAVGLYITTLIMIAQGLSCHRRTALPGALIALTLLGAGGSTYLAINKAKFGNPTIAHGSFEPGEIQYGAAYWGWETTDSMRQEGFTEHGRFNPGRIFPNAAMYFAAPPSNISPEMSARARALHRAVTIPRVGYGRIEPPSIGLIFIWTLWVILAGIGIAKIGHHGRPYAALLTGFLSSTLLILSYPTLTLRYYVDLWPFLAILALLGVAHSCQHPIPTGWRGAVLGCAAGIGLAVSAGTTAIYTYNFRNYEASFFEEWSESECYERAKYKELSDDHRAYVCRPPLTDKGD